MSGPQDIQGIARMFGMPSGPRPTMPLGQSQKRLGDQRVPTGQGMPQRHPGQVQDQAARKLGVPNYQVQPTERPQTPQPPQPQIQAPPPPSLPTPMPRSRPEGAPLPPEINPRAMAAGRIPMPMGRPEGAGPRPSPTGDPGQLNRMADALIGVLGGLMGGGGGTPRGNAPPSTFPYLSGSNASAVAKPTPNVLPPSDPFASGAPGIQPGIEQLIPALAARAKAKAEQEQLPVQAPEATRPSPNVTPPVPPGRPIPPPPAVTEKYTPSQPTFKGYEVRPPPPKKGEAKDKTKALAKDNNLYYYSRIGVQQDDNRAVAQRIAELREKASNPKTAKNMTREEDRILTQYSDFAKRGGQPGMLKSMEPDAVNKRMQEYKSGTLTTQIPDRYQERAPGAESDSGPTQLKLPPKKQSKAERLAEEAIENPPPRNATDSEKIVVEED